MIALLTIRKTGDSCGEGAVWCRKYQTNEEQVRVQVLEKTDQAEETRFLRLETGLVGDGANLCVWCARVVTREADHVDRSDDSPRRCGRISRRKERARKLRFLHLGCLERKNVSYEMNTQARRNRNIVVAKDILCQV